MVLGALATAALPPVDLLPLAVVGFVGLVWLLDGADRRLIAIGIGWWFGVGHSATAYYWIANSLLVDVARHGWLYPPSLAAIAAGFALFPALVAGVAWTWRPGLPRVVAFGVTWVAVEWLRSWLFTGFPWNLMGTAFDIDVRLLQPAALAGVHGLSVIVMTVCLLPALSAYGAPERLGRRALYTCSAAILVVAATGAYGGWRLAALEPLAGQTPVDLRLIQPNIAQSEKWRPDLYLSHIAMHIEHSQLQSETVPDIVIWPETAIPYRVFRDRDIVDALVAAAVPPGGVLMAGAVTSENDGSGARFFNSLVVFDDRRELIAVYDKHHLVPFGEYVPLRGVLPIDKLTPGTTDFTAGPAPRTLELDGLPAFSPLICYEAIFPAGVVAPGERPAWLLNVTNDAWFGNSSGPYQHLASARLRTVEQGLPMARAANTGVSAVIDAAGRYVARLDLEQEGVIDTRLPPPLAPTIYSLWGNWTLLTILFPFIVYLACSLLGIPPKSIKRLPAQPDRRKADR